MKVRLNGQPRELADGARGPTRWTRSARRAGVAVALDGDVVSRASWAGHALSDGACVEVLTAVQGG